MIISDFYQTRIEASNYNVNIDSTDTVITVTLIDFNGVAVTGKSVTLTCDRGYFNKNGSTAISGTTTKSITATTDSNGKITATWTASEWGLATFSTSNSSQPSHIQVNVTGWKTHFNSGEYTVRYNDSFVEVRVHIGSSVTAPGAGSEWGDILSSSNPDLRPTMPYLFYDTQGKVQLRLSDVSTKIWVRSASGSNTSQNIYGMGSYPRR